MKHLLLFCALLPFIWTSCSDSAPGSEPDPTAPTATEAFNVYMDSIFDAAVDRDPEWETRLGIRTHYRDWSDISDQARAAELVIRQAELQDMEQRFDPATLDRQARLSFRLFQEKVHRMEERAKWRLYHYPVNQMHGVHAETISFLINSHRIDSLPDAEAYLSRLAKLPLRMEQLTANLEVRRTAGIIPPQFVFPMVIKDCRNLLKGSPFEEVERPSTLYADFADKLAGLELDAAVQEDMLGKCASVLEGQVAPAYQGLISYLENLEQEADDRDGAWKFPDGDAFYRHALRQTTTTDMSPEQVHQTGLDEVARIHGEMRAIMEQVGFEGSLQEFFEFMRTDPQFYYPNTDAGREAYLAEATGLIDTMRARLPSIFATLPQAEIVVKRVEPYREQSAGKAFYNKGAPDGSRPGTYYANLYDMANMPTYQMEALAYHEGIPGHHMQLSIAMELDAIPKFRRYDHYTAYIEGWALYTEWVPTTMGFYQDPYSDFGRLAMELWRACRLVVDTGIHWKKWTRQEAIDYLKENTPNPEGDVVKAIERYIVMPSQATAYKIGMLKIMELRSKAEAEMGERFDVRQFHDVILTNGAVPLNVLEELVEEWMAG